MSTYFIADTHFGDEGIIRYEGRPFVNTQEMDKTLISNWNDVVKNDDLVFVLGDFSVYDKEKNAQILAQLKGKKILVLGNHDRHYSEEEWRSMGFAGAYEYPIVFQNFFILSHEPLYMNRNMPYVNVFGHVHANPMYKDYSGWSFCVSVERIHYTPIVFEDVRKLLHGQ